MSGKDDALYGCETDEQLQESVEAVVEAWFDETDGPFDNAAENIEWPLKVYVYRRKTVSEQDKALNAGRVLARILDDLDDEYGDPDGDHTESTPGMMEAAKAFVEAVCREYAPWACERTGEVVQVTRGEARKMVEG